MEGQNKWTSVFYWNNYPLQPSLEMFNVRYLHHAETLDKFTGVPKLVGYVQFKTPMTLEDLYAINADNDWINQSGAYMTVTKLGHPFPMRDRQPPPPTLTPSLSMREREQSSALLSPNAPFNTRFAKRERENTICKPIT